MLSCEAVSVAYGPVRALHGVTLEVQEHEVVAVVGANGAGKSTLLRAIMGLVRVQRGRILFCGRDLLGRRPYEITRLGVALVPEGRRVFAGLTVEENLDLGGVTLAPAARRERLEEAYRWFPVLAERRRRDPSRDGSSRCWPSPAASCRPRGSSSWTSPHSGSPPAWCARWGRPSPPSGPGGRRSCWPSRTPSWPCGSRRGPTSSRWAGSPWRATAATSSRART